MESSEPKRRDFRSEIAALKERICQLENDVIYEQEQCARKDKEIAHIVAQLTRTRVLAAKINKELFYVAES